MTERVDVSDPGFEVVVVGAGVVGLAVAAAQSRAGRSVLILEGDSGIGRGITSRNSEVIHAGLYYPADSLKAEFCVRGREALYAYCEAHSVGHRRLGKLVVATSVDEEPIVAQLLERGRANGVEGLALIDAPAISRLEPEVNARLALHSPETGIIDGQQLCLALLAETESKGGVLALDSTVVGLAERSHGWQLEVSRPGGEIERIDAGIVVDAAGLDADRVAEMAGLDVDALGWRQHPCKGDYFVLGPGVKVGIDRLIYPVPAQAGLGIHATLDLAGRIRFGPDAEYVPKPGFDVDPGKAAAFRRAATRYLPGLAKAELLPDYAGIRPKLAAEGEPFRDFVVEETSAQGRPCFVACLGIESPGLTSALAIAERVASLISI
jgi:L-2-hydroxyglutarate oxidase LhgO